MARAVVPVPEFKGQHADLYWAVLETKEAPITIVADTEDLFLRFGPAAAHAALPVRETAPR